MESLLIKFVIASHRRGVAIQSILILPTLLDCFRHALLAAKGCSQ